MNTRDAAEQLRSTGLLYTQEQVAELASNHTFPNAQKINNVWNTPDEDILSFINYQNGRRRRRRIIITGGTIALIIAILSLISITKDGLDLYKTYIQPFFEKSSVVENQKAMRPPDVGNVTSEVNQITSTPPAVSTLQSRVMPTITATFPVKDGMVEIPTGKSIQGSDEGEIQKFWERCKVHPLSVVYNSKTRRLL